MRNVSLDRQPHKLNQTTQRSVKIAQHVAKKALQSQRSIPVHDKSERSGDSRQLRSLLSSNVAAIQAKKENAEIQSLFKEQFGDLAQDKKAFHAFLKQVFGPNYDVKKAEAFRQQACKGDYSWLPPIEFVDGKTLQGGNGAYDAQSGVVYLNSDLRHNPALLAQTYVEEAGHHLDAQLNKSDTVGDEGELFRRILAGESLSHAQISAIKSENDKGTIYVAGKAIEVEFWNPFKAIGNAVKSVVKGVVKVAKGIGNAVAGVARTVGKAVKGVVEGAAHVVKGVGEALVTCFEGVGEGLYGFVDNLVHLRPWKAVKSLVKGLEKAVISSSAKLVDGVLNGVESAVHGVTELLGPLKGPVRFVTDRLMDATRSVVGGAFHTVAGIARNLIESGLKIGDGIGQILKGNFSDGFGTIGKALFSGVIQTPIDAILMSLGSTVSAVQTLIGLEQPGKKLTPSQISMLREIYGDSIDYDSIRIKEGSAGLFSTNGRPFTLGNTIYLKDAFASDELLAHEVFHVWQHQNGGTDYMSEAIYSQEKGKGYDWQQSVPQTPFEQLEPEQQAELIEDALAAGYFDASNPATYHQFEALIDGQTVDLSAYMADALKKIHAGVGAP